MNIVDKMEWANQIFGPIPLKLIQDQHVSLPAKILFRLITGGIYILQPDDMSLFDELVDKDYIPKYLNHGKDISNKNY